MQLVDRNFNSFIAAENTLSTAAPSTLTGRAIYKFNPLQALKRIPLHVRTGPQTLQNMHDYRQYDAAQPTERKRFDQVEFHGKGNLYVRVYVDGVWIADGYVTLTETPSKDRRMGLPTGTKGYLIDLEFCGDSDLRAVEYSYRHLASPS